MLLASLVADSWRSLDSEETLVAPYGDPDSPDYSPDYCRQEARSFIKNLKAQAWWDPSETPNLSYYKHLESKFPVILEEFKSVTSSSSKMSSGNNIWASAADSTSASSYGPDWKTLVLMDRTTWDPVNSVLFPKTCEAIIEAGVPCVEAFFARMDGKTKIKPHTDR